MKSKLYNRIMLPAVLLIWAGVLWRVFAPEDDGAMPVTVVAGLPEQKAKTSDEVLSLRLGYRDPFLDRKGVRAVTALEAPAASKPSITVVETKPVVNYPKVRYLGGVASEDGLITGVIQVGAAFYNVQQGDTVAGLMILNLSLREGKIQFADSTWMVKK